MTTFKIIIYSFLNLPSSWFTVVRVREKCWYAPIEDEEIMQIAYNWALSQPITSVLPPGEFDLWKKALKVINNYKLVEDHEIKKLESFSENKLPLFTA